MYKFSILLCLLIAGLSFYGCNESSFNAGLENLFGVYDTDVKDESSYEFIPFEMAINKAFSDKLQRKKFRFKAKYKGTSPNPGPWKSVKDFVNLNLCDLEKIEVCSDLIVIKSDKADTIFNLKNDQIVDVFGILLEIKGFETGSGEQINWSQLNSKAPYNFIRVFKIVSSDMNETQYSMKEAFSKEDISKTQYKLKELGYDPGPVDGAFGKKTSQAILKYQKDHNLSLTGKLDKDTAIKLGISK